MSRSKGAPKVILYQKDVVWINEVRKFIEHNINEDLTIKSISSRFTVSESKLRRYFYALYKVSIAHFILTFRMKLAMTLLQHHEVTIGQVGTMVGYKDRSAFTHAFTKFYNQTPYSVIKSTDFPMQTE